MVRELDTVALTQDLEKYAVRRGDVGAVVHCYSGGESLEVEFVTAEGKTIVLLTLDTTDIRPLSGSEILHVREFTPV